MMRGGIWIKWQQLCREGLIILGKKKFHLYTNFITSTGNHVRRNGSSLQQGKKILSKRGGIWNRSSAYYKRFRNVIRRKRNESVHWIFQIYNKKRLRYLRMKRFKKSVSTNSAI